MQGKSNRHESCNPRTFHLVASHFSVKCVYPTCPAIGLIGHEESPASPLAVIKSEESALWRFDLLSFHPAINGTSHFLRHEQ
jgi:hypothetical protein